MADRLAAFKDWLERAVRLALLWVKSGELFRSLNRQRREAKTQAERDTIAPAFTQAEEERRGIFTDAKAFREELERAFPNPGERNVFVNEVEKRALQGLFRTKVRGEIVDYAEKMVRVISPWRRDTLAVIHLRDVLGLRHVASKDEKTIALLIKAGEEYLARRADDVPDLYASLSGEGVLVNMDADPEEVQEVSDGLKYLRDTLSRIAEAKARREQAGRDQQRRKENEVTEDDFTPPSGGSAEPALPENPVERMKVQISDLISKAGAMRTEAKDLFTKGSYAEATEKAKQADTTDAEVDELSKQLAELEKEARTVATVSASAERVAADVPPVPLTTVGEAAKETTAGKGSRKRQPKQAPAKAEASGEVVTPLPATPPTTEKAEVAVPAQADPMAEAIGELKKEIAAAIAIKDWAKVTQLTETAKLFGVNLMAEK